MIFKEKRGVEGRGGYFDQYGIIRDVMQNHLLQMMALVAMEQPLSLSAEHIRREKLKVLQSVAPLEMDDLVIGQVHSLMPVTPHCLANYQCGVYAGSVECNRYVVRLTQVH